MFEKCPEQIGNYTREDYNTEVKYDNPEVILELIEYDVFLPILAYSLMDQKIWVEFNKTEYRLLNGIVGAGEAEIIETFKPTKLEDALHHLVHFVEREAGLVHA